MKKWEICFVIGDKLSESVVIAQTFRAVVLDTVVCAEFVNFEPRFRQVAFYSHVVYVHQLGEGANEVVTS